MIQEELINSNITLTNNKLYILQFLPENIKYLTDKKYVEFNKKKLKADYLIDIIHQLILKYYFFKENMFNLSSVILREKYGTFYNFYIDYLISDGYIMLASNYFVGKKTKTFSLTDKILNFPIERYKNCNKYLLKKYKISSIETDNLLINTNIKKKLISDLYYVNINYDKACNYLNNEIKDKNIFERNLYCIDSIKEGHIFYNFDNYGRFHTNFTVLKKYIRQNCLTINGEEVCEKDLPNSQPLFLTLLIQKNHHIVVNEKEFNLFKYLTVNGELYNYIQEKYLLENRTIAKELIYKVFFGKNNNNKPNQIFKKLFPTIHNFICQFKIDNNNYKILAYELQRAESYLIFNKIITDIIKLDRNIILFTVHDSICYAKKYNSIVSSIFENHVNKLLA